MEGIDLPAFLGDSTSFSNLSDWEDKSISDDAAKLYRKSCGLRHQWTQQDFYLLVRRMPLEDRLDINEALNVFFPDSKWVTRKEVRKIQEAYNVGNVHLKEFGRAIIGLPRPAVDSLLNLSSEANGRAKEIGRMCNKCTHSSAAGRKTHPSRDVQHGSKHSRRTLPQASAAETVNESIRSAGKTRRARRGRRGHHAKKMLNPHQSNTHEEAKSSRSSVSDLPRPSSRSQQSSGSDCAPHEIHSAAEEMQPSAGDHVRKPDFNHGLVTPPQEPTGKELRRAQDETISAIETGTMRTKEDICLSRRARYLLGSERYLQGLVTGSIWDFLRQLRRVKRQAGHSVTRASDFEGVSALYIQRSMPWLAIEDQQRKRPKEQFAKHDCNTAHSAPSPKSATKNLPSEDCSDEEADYVEPAPLQDNKNLIENHQKQAPALATELTPSKKRKRRQTSQRSPYFPTAQASPKRRRVKGGTVRSSLPFPPLTNKSFGLIQEQVAHDPFQLLVACALLNRTKGIHALPVFFELMAKHPDPASLAAADMDDVVDVIGHLGLQNQRALNLILIAKVWIEQPPEKGKRYRTLHYPTNSVGGDIKPREIVADESIDPRIGAWEVAHLPGVGGYALDSWRIFCRDVLRGLAKDWKGKGREEASSMDGRRRKGPETAKFEPEWKRVLPQDKELRAYLRWMWLREGYEWDAETGIKKEASQALIEKANSGKLEWDDSGRLVSHEEEDGREILDSEIVVAY